MGGRRSRFFGSTWQAYFVETVILGVGTCILVLRALEYALDKVAHGGPTPTPCTTR